MTTEDIYTNAFSNARVGWTRVGASPYLNDSSANYVRTKNVAGEEIGDWSFPNSAIAAGDTLNGVSLRLECNRSAAGFETIDVYLYDGSSWYFVDSIDPSYGLWEWFSIDVLARLNTIAKINASQVYLKSISATVKLLCRRLVRRVDYSPPVTIQPIQGDGLTFTN